MQNILILEQSPKGNKFWVEEDLRRVCLSLAHLPLYITLQLQSFQSMCPQHKLGHKSPLSASWVLDRAKFGARWRVDIGSAHYASKYLD